MTDFAISLSVTTAETAGYTPTTSTDGLTPYYFKYTGGSDGAGNVIVHKNTPSTIVVTLSGGANFAVSSVNVANDDMGDITTSHTTTTATIVDSARDLESNMEYTVMIYDDVAQKSFGCDPKIDNVD